MAYKAYEKWVADNGIVEKLLFNLNYTPQQMFWISAASILCSKATNEHLRNRLKNHKHCPHEALVTIVFGNNENFAKDFNCKIDSKMNPEKRCELW